MEVSSKRLADERTPLVKISKNQGQLFEGFWLFRRLKRGIAPPSWKIKMTRYAKMNTYRVIHTNILCTIFRCLGKEMKIHRDLFMMILNVAG